MKLAQQLRFLHWFAMSDLFEPSARRTTLVNRRSITIVTALTVASFGVALAVRELGLAQLKRQPFARCLTIGNSNAKPQFTPEVVASLKHDLEETFNKASGVGFSEPIFQGIFPFHELRYEVARLASSKGGDGLLLAPLFEGRTVNPDSGDPILEAIGSVSNGVIATQSLIDALDPPEEPRTSPTEPPQSKTTEPRKTPPPKLTLVLPRGKEEVSLAGVIDLVLPLDHQFIMSEAFEQSLRDSKRARLIYTGEVPVQSGKYPVPGKNPWPDQWPDDRLLLPGGAVVGAAFAVLADRWPAFGSPFGSVVEILENPEYKITRISRAQRKGRKVWEILSRRPDPPDLTAWKDLLERIRTVMEAQGFDRAPRFVPADASAIDAPESQRVTALRSAGYTMASVYVSDVSYLEAAADAVEKKHGFRVLRSFIARIKEINGESGRRLTVILAIAGLLLFNSCANMAVIQKLRAEQKLTEIGMLKAMGMDASLLRMVHVYEALVIWLGGTIRGLVLGLIFGGAFAWLFVSGTPQDLLHGFFGFWFLVALATIPLITGVAFLASSVRGTREARVASPIVTLQST